MKRVLSSGTAIVLTILTGSVVWTANQEYQYRPTVTHAPPGKDCGSATAEKSSPSSWPRLFDDRKCRKISLTIHEGGIARFYRVIVKTDIVKSDSEVVVVKEDKKLCRIVDIGLEGGAQLLRLGTAYDPDARGGFGENNGIGLLKIEFDKGRDLVFGITLHGFAIGAKHASPFNVCFSGHLASLAADLYYEKSGTRFPLALRQQLSGEGKIRGQLLQYQRLRAGDGKTR